jgi:hypothetical protein
MIEALHQQDTKSPSNDAICFKNRDGGVKVSTIIIIYANSVAGWWSVSPMQRSDSMQAAAAKKKEDIRR